jgi:hypothetical protein
VIASDEIRLGNPDPIPLARSASSTAAGLFPSWGSPAPHLTSPTVAAARRIRSAGPLLSYLLGALLADSAAMSEVARREVPELVRLFIAATSAQR